ncbi:nuclear transport factor 2 family protein [Tenacibaculum sp. 190524A02b]|uniref:nuclear transport factor 2 family protein n=1 Tax=Tenacibaculum vairaonense TaxID=3137860 RepID=UPI0031FAF7CB
MKFNHFVLLLCLSVNVQYSYSQSINNLKEINIVWAKFYKAFETLDAEIMAEIHDKDLIRISGGKRISNYTTYINSYKKRFASAQNNGMTNTIALRFFERINNDSIASERGVYQLTRLNKQKNKKVYYGQFHVLLVKKNNTWKIIMDYDSNESNTITKNDFLKAFPINNITVFTSK